MSAAMGRDHSMSVRTASHGQELDVHLVRRPGLAVPACRWLRGFLRRVAEAAGCSATEVTVLLTGDEEMQALNHRYRGADRTTDVLSFEGGPQPDGRVSHGEIVISVDKARRQAKQRHHAIEVELRYLLIHGFLHLMGFDHESDSGEMATEELRLRNLLLVQGRSGRTTGRRARA
jgi:probable rRNA maturation factor